MGSPAIPDEVRPWVEATAPTLTAKDWGECRGWIDAGIAGPGRSLWEITIVLSVGGVTPEQARALLAYVDEIAAGLTGTAAMVLRSSPGLSLAQPELIGPGLVAEDDSGFAYFTPLGREVAAVLGGDR